MARQKKLPKEIFVKWDGEDPPYLDARESSSDFYDGDKVGVYTLAAIKTQKVTDELV